MKNGPFSSRFNLHSKSINVHFGYFWVKYQGYSLTLWPKMSHFHHFSICNQNQLISILVICGQNTKAIALLYGHKWINFIDSISSYVIFGQNIKVIALLFGEKWPIFITFQSATKIINLNFGHYWAKYQGYSPTFWPKMDQFHHLSICNQSDLISILVIFGQYIKVIALLFGEKWPIFITFQSATKINQSQFWSLLGKIPRL